MADEAFVAIDVETANADMASICQVGLVRYEGGHPVREWSSLVNPEAEFDWWNVDVHGITEDRVRDAPTYADIHDELSDWCAGQIVVCHTHFDRTSVHRASVRYDISPPDCTWLDSARVVRRAWEQFSKRGYGLSNVCKHLGYSYTAHDALEDAKACGHVLSRAIEQSGLSLAEWLDRLRRSSHSGTSSSGLRAVQRNRDGPLSGEVIVFTGALTMPRREAATLAAQAGADVPTSVNGKTTILVVGDQDIQKLAGHAKSSKHRRAEELNRGGHSIRIMQESDFLELLRIAEQ